MFFSSQLVRKMIGGTFLLSLCVSFGFAYLHIKSMDTMDMPGCPFMNEFTTVCSMSPIEHIQAWQHTFTVIADVGMAVLLLLIAAFALLGSYLFQGFWPKPHTVSFHTQTPPTRNPQLRNYLQEAFSRGILNPKLF